MKKALLTIAIAAVFSAIASSSAHAVILFADTFDSKSSGSGFDGDWTAGGSYTSGSFNNGGDEVYRDLESSIDTSTMDFWLILDIDIVGDNTGWGGVSIADNANMDFFIGSDSASINWEFNTDVIGDTETSIENFTAGTNMLVLHITSSSIDLWVDPSDTSSEAALGAADASASVNPVTPNGNWNRLRIGSGNGSPEPTVTLDNMVAATTLGEAVFQRELPSGNANLLYNNGFELGNTSGWDTFDNAGGSVSISTVASPVYNGSYACRVENRTATWHSIRQDIDSIMSTGETYTVSIWARLGSGSDVAATLKVKIDDDSGPHYTVLDTQTLTAGSWTKLQGQYTYGYTGTIHQANFYISDVTPGIDLLVDEASIKRYSVAGTVFSIK